MEEVEVEVAIIGGGIIGLACAQSLSNSCSVALIEKNNFLLNENSSRNSGVIHSGIYYGENSKKNYHCLRGNRMMYQYCKENNIFHKNTGKFIVAKKQEQDKFEDIYNQAVKKEIPVTLIDNKKLQDMYSAIDTDLVMFIQSSGIVDVHDLSESIQKRINMNNGYILTRTLAEDIEIKNGFFKILVNQNDERYLIKSRFLVTALGIHTPDFLETTRYLMRIN